MRILLAHNSLYYPSAGGGDKSNRLLMEALAQHGHAVRVVTRVEKFGAAAHDHVLAELAQRGVQPAIGDAHVSFTLRGVDVRLLTRSTHWRPFFAAQIKEFSPEVIITSTDDPGQILLTVALESPARIVHLVRATIAVPFGPDASSVSAAKTEVLRRVDGMVGVSEYVAGYAREHGGIPDAIHVPISLLDPGETPLLGRFENPYVAMINPCAVKGISIFLGLADRMPHLRFSCIPAWGTTHDDLAELRKRPNIHIHPWVDNIDEYLKLTQVMLVPSVWAEARSRVVLEAMSRGVPVVAADVGGLHEAKLGVPHLIPVNPVKHYQAVLDEHMVPIAQVPPQDVTPWVEVLERLCRDRREWTELSESSRKAALEYAADLSAGPFERFLLSVMEKPKRHAPAAGARGGGETQPRAAQSIAALSPEKRRLLALKLKEKAAGTGAEAAGNPWFPGLDAADAATPRLFCFPYAGGGTRLYQSWAGPLKSRARVCPVRLPGRESRAKEQPFDDMTALIEALGAAFEQTVLPAGARYAFFGHSMGAGIAFELTRWLRRRGCPLPERLIVSSARAPQLRTAPAGPEPTDAELVSQVHRLGGLPTDVAGNPELLQLALPVLRADTRLYRNYTFTYDTPLDIPLLVYGGEADPSLSAEHLDAWREQTAAVFVRRQFPGGHLYLQSAAGFLDTLAGDL